MAKSKLTQTTKQFIRNLNATPRQRGYIKFLLNKSGEAHKMAFRLERDIASIDPSKLIDALKSGVNADGIVNAVVGTAEPMTGVSKLDAKRWIASGIEKAILAGADDYMIPSDRQAEFLASLIAQNWDELDWLDIAPLTKRDASELIDELVS